MSELDLQQVQVGKETVWGTAVAATAKIMDANDFVFQPQVNTKVNRSRRGSLTTGFLAALVEAWGKAQMKGKATYDDLPFHIESLFGVATPTGTGPYVRAYTSPTAAITPRQQTLYYGNTAAGVFRMPGATGSKLTITAEKQAEVLYTLDLLGKRVESGATLAALSDRTTTPLYGNDLTIYVDNFGVAAGTTVVADTHYSLTLEMDARRAVNLHLGNFQPSAIIMPGWMGKLSMHLEYNTLSQPWLNGILAATAVQQKVVRLKWQQGANNIVQIDFAGTFETSPEIFVDEQGMAALDMVLTDTYESLLAAWCKISVTNNVAALP